MIIGSPFLKWTSVLRRISRQFIVNVYGAQSVSTMPSSGMTPSLIVFVTPRAHSPTPRGVRNSHGSDTVRIPDPKWLEMNRPGLPASSWNRIFSPSSRGDPSHTHENDAGHRTTHPAWFAMTSGRQRYANLLGVASIQSRLPDAGSMTHPSVLLTS